MFKSINKIIKYKRLTQDYPNKPIDSSLFIGKPEIDSAKCTFCGECTSRCPSRAIVMNKDTNVIGINLDECVVCTLCEEICQTGAAKMTNQFELAASDRTSLRNSTLVIEDRSIPDADYPDRFFSIPGILWTKSVRMFMLMKTRSPVKIARAPLSFRINI